MNGLKNTQLSENNVCVCVCVCVCEHARVGGRQSKNYSKCHSQLTALTQITLTPSDKNLTFSSHS